MKTLSFLIMMAMISALGVVQMKYRTRLLFSDVQKLQLINEAYDEELAQLQFEQNKWAERERIEREASTRLGMILPDRGSIISIQP